MTQPEPTAGLDPGDVARLPPQLEFRDRSCAMASRELDQAVEKIRLYLRCLQLSECSETDRLLVRTVQEAERRLAASEPADPAAVILEELHRLLPVNSASSGRSIADLLVTVPTPTPTPSPQRMADQRLDYWAPMRALRDLVVGLMESIFPRLRRYGQ